MLEKKTILFLILFLALAASGYSQNWQDTNCDGKIDIIDALIIAQYYVGIRSSLQPCGYEILPVADQQLQFDLRKTIGKPGGILTIEDAKGIEEIDFNINDYYTSLDYFIGLDYIDLYGLDSYPDLKKINIGANQIYSASVLAECEKLESLKLYLMDFIDDLSIFNKLTSLKELHLDSKGVLIDDFSFLEDYESLTSFGLLIDTNNPINSLKNIPVLLQLKKISLDDHADLDWIYKFPNLESLTVNPISKYTYYNNIINFSFLKSIPKLVELIVPRNLINDISALHWVPGLKKVNIEENKHLYNIAALQFVPDLIELNLSKTSVKDVKILSRLHYLEKLYLSGIVLKDIDFLSSLTLLEELDISNYDGSKGYAVLFTMENLKQVIVAPKLKDIDISNREELLELASRGVVVASSDGKTLEVDINE